MERTTRKRLLRIAFVTFFLAAPVLLLYAHGYRAFRGTFGRPSGAVPWVGAIVVRTIPRGAAVAIDGRVVDRRTPAGVANLPEGTYAVRIEKRGYRHYEKRVQVVGGKVTDLLFVRLVPLSVGERVVLTGSRTFWSSPDGSALLVSDGAGVALYDARDLQRQVVTAAIGTPHGRVISTARRTVGTADVHWSPSGRTTVIDSPREGSAFRLFTAVDVSTGETVRPSRSGLAIGWTRLGPEEFILLTPERELLALPRTPLEGRPMRVIAAGVHTAAIHPRGVVISQEGPFGTFLSLLTPDGTRTPLGLPSDQDLSALWVSPFGSIAALSSDGLLSILPSGAEAWRAIAHGAGSIQWSPDGDKLLYRTSPFDLWVVNVSEERSVLPLFSPTLLIRLSVPIREPQWFPDSQRVLFIEHDILEWVELDPRDGHHVEHLASSNRGDSVYAVRPDGDFLWLTARRNGTDVLLELSLRTLRGSM